MAKCHSTSCKSIPMRTRVVFQNLCLSGLDGVDLRVAEWMDRLHVLQSFINIVSPSWVSDKCWMAVSWRLYSLTSTWSAAILFFQLSAKPYVLTAPQPRGWIDIFLWKLTSLTRTNAWRESHSICTWRKTREYLWVGPRFFPKSNYFSAQK